MTTWHRQLGHAKMLSGKPICNGASPKNHSVKWCIVKRTIFVSLHIHCATFINIRQRWQYSYTRLDGNDNDVEDDNVTVSEWWRPIPHGPLVHTTLTTTAKKYASYVYYMDHTQGWTNGWTWLTWSLIDMCQSITHQLTHSPTTRGFFTLLQQTFSKRHPMCSCHNRNRKMRHNTERYPKIRKRMKKENNIKP